MWSGLVLAKYVRLHQWTQWGIEPQELETQILFATKAQSTHLT